MDKKVYYDESINEQIAVHNKILIYKLISATSIHIHPLCRALTSALGKLASFRAAVIYNQDNLSQNLTHLLSNDLYTLDITYVTSDTHLNTILFDEETNQSLFNVKEGKIFRCHFLLYSTISDNHKDWLDQNDIIIFNFHYTIADDSSVLMFIDDLQTTLTEQKSYENNAKNLDCELNQSSADQEESLTRTKTHFTAKLDLDQHLVANLTQFMSQFNFTIFELGLAAFYTFLFKLSNSEQHDLCISIQQRTGNQKYKMNDKDNMFVNYLPFQLQIDPYEPFTQLCYRIQKRSLDILSHFNLPYEEFVKLHPSLETSPHRTIFLTESSIDNVLQVLNFGNGIILQKINENLFNQDISKSHLICTFYENSQNQPNSIRFSGSFDIYDEATISTMIHRFERLLHQIFSNPPVYQLSILLSTEIQLMDDLNHTDVDYGEIGCIHWDIARRAQQHPQKIALVLQNGSITYAELLYYTQYLATHIITNYTIQPDHVICQLVERSFEMVIGIIAIMMTGAIYTGLSSRDPLVRLEACIQQTSAQLIFIHHATHHIPLTLCSLIRIDQIISLDKRDHANFSSIDTIDVTPEHISHIVFTSGSTGIPKAIQLRHRNFVSYIRSYLIQSTDVTLHHTSVTFDAHLEEILGTALMGGQVVLLQPDGHLDFEVFSKTISSHQVTYMGTVPSRVVELITFLQSKKETNLLETLRCIASGGETLFTRTVTDIMCYLNENCRFYNYYGPAECTEAAIEHLVTKDDLAYRTVSLGRPVANVRIYLVDEYLQPVIPGIHVGEIVIGGAGVFAGYRDRDDLTNLVLCKINNEICYRTGDLGRLNPITRFFEYCGRQDYQVKLRGQRIELGEIESIIMEKANMCIVIKTTYMQNDYLVAYVETKSSEDDLRQYCLSRLPLYMVPSFFIIIDKLPLNQNGKIDRKFLPSVDFTSLSPLVDKSEQSSATEMEQNVYRLWCQVLPYLTSIPSTSTSFFSLGGSSLSLMKLVRLYKQQFKCDVDITHLFQRSTIADHAQLLEEKQGYASIVSDQWLTLNIIEGAASFAQTRIYLDERIRLTDQEHLSLYNIVFPFEIVNNSCVSMKRLHRALYSVINKHAILRTQVVFHKQESSILYQTILNSMKFPFQISTLLNKDYNVENILRNEETNSSLFNYEQGCVFRCHVIRCTQLITDDDDDLLLPNDIIIFNFHHIAFDGTSINIFLSDLSRAYANKDIGISIFNYIDYSIHERELDLYQSKQFWHDHLHNYNSHVLQLPFDRIPHNTQIRSGRGTIATFAIDPSIVDNILSYTIEHHVTLFQLGLTAFYSFIFKLTGDIDVCVANLNENRFRPELADIIGFFVNTLPYRFVVNPRQTFLEMLQHVTALCIAALPHSHVPYQDIISTNLPIQTLFTIEEINNNQVLQLDDDTMIRPFIKSETETSTNIFDLECSILHSTEKRSMIILLQGSLDLFDNVTIATMAQRFEHLFHQIFMHPPIHEMSILLPNELNLINDLNNTYVDYGKIACIHWDIARRAQQHPQKIALVLQNGSITYAELLYYTQYLATHIITNYTIQPDHVICQLVERSFEMIIGIIAILMTGAIYTGLSSRDPLARLQACIQQTSAQLIFIHHATHHIPLTLCSLIRIDQIISLDKRDHANFSSIDMIDVTPEHISHIVFTSGSTGIPKAIQLRHRNFVSYIRSYLIQSTDVTLHHTSVTFDAHLGEILGTALMGGQVVLLQPEGHLDFEVLSSTISSHQVTYMGTVPSQVAELVAFLQNKNGKNLLDTLRCISSGGETLFTRTVIDIRCYLNENCRLYNYYGPAECTEAAIEHLVTKDDLAYRTVPIGRPMSNVRIYLVDEYLQTVIPGIHVGEIVIGGAGVFAGYRDRDDLTNLVLCKINNEICYRTGDLGRLNSITHFLEYCGRQDYQVKLRGQRIELGEIESIIMEKANMCIVIKTTYMQNDYLVAYVETKSSEDDLRQYCLSRLPLYMVPSFFIILHKLPLNQNGKIDRKALPSVDFTSLSPLVGESEQSSVTEMEQNVYRLWCQVLPYLTSIPSTSTSFFSLGGSSLSLMKLVRLYKQQLNCQVKISHLFQRSTIAGHAQLLEEKRDYASIVSDSWMSLNIFQGPASYTQTSIWLAERVRFIGWPQVSAYNVSSLLQVDSGYFSINKCIQVLNEIVSHHWIFRTRLTFDIEQNCLHQTIHQQIHYPISLTTYKDEVERETIARNEVRKPFNTESDGVFRCHFIRQYDHERKDELSSGDVIIFHFHHGSFDGQAMDLFFEQFKLAYENKQLQSPNLQYIDYSIHERTLLMTEAQNYWRKALKGYAWDRRLDLDSLPSSALSARRRDQGSSVTVKIPYEIVNSMIEVANQLNVTLFQLGLTCFYIFLSQLSPNNRDACIGINYLNRYRPELASMIGMFVNVLPCRITIDSLDTISFVELINKVQKIFLESTQYSHLPYQKLIDLHRVSNSNIQLPFLQAIFRVDADTIDYNHTNGIMLNNSCHLSNYILQNPSIGGHVDLEVSLIYNKTARTIECEWLYLLDAFNKSTIDIHANRFVLLLSDLFRSNFDEQLQLPLSKIIILKKEERDKLKENNISMHNSPTPAVSIFKTNKEQELIDRICNVFCQVLDRSITDIDIDRSFFEQGGTSLKALQAIMLLQKDISLQIDSQQFFDDPSVIHLAQAILKKE